MAKESLFHSDSSVVFRETFNSENDTIFNGGSLTDVVYNNGIGNFNGSTSKVQFPAINLNLTHSIYIKFKLTEIPSSPNIAMGGDDSVAGDPYLVSFGSTTIFYNGAAGGGGAVNANWTADTDWHELIISRDNTSVCFYLDGTLLSDEALGSNNNATFKWIGTRNGSSSFFKGDIDLIDLYNRTLTPEEVELIYENSLYREPVFSNEVLSIDSRNGSIYDKYGNPITNENVEIVRYGSVYTQEYNGSSSYLNLGSDSSFEINGDISYVFWFRKEATIGTDYVFYLGEESLGKRRIVFFGPNFLSFNSFGAGNTVSTTTNYDNNIDYCAVITVEKSSKEVIIYIDGQQENSGTLNDLNDYDVSVNGLIIGAETTFLSNFDGYLSPIKIVSGLLTAKQAAQYYNSTKTYYDK